MSETKFTPGPWERIKVANGDAIRIFSGSRYIATVGNSDDSVEVTAANAALVHAAPELLSACKDVISHSFFGESTGYQHVDKVAIQRVINAIARATQEESK